MAEPQKATIYLDVDDEITSVIDKVNSSREKIVALVLPKRATVFHSVVNMKLLKRAADLRKKHLVLITSETGVLPLAGAVGLHVARTPQSKPIVPPAPSTIETPLQISESVEDEPIDKSVPIGVLAGLPNEEDETIQINNNDKPDLIPPVMDKKASKKLRIPSFDKFRTRLFLGIAALVLLIVGWVFAAMILPKARIIVKTDTTNIDTKLTITASPKAKELQKEEKIVPARTKEFKKTDALKVPATGEKDNGTKAGGTVTFTNCTGSPVTIPAGTGISSNGLTFITLKAVNLDSGNFTLPPTSTCKANGSHVDEADVVAQSNGDKYNLSARSYQISGVAGDVRAAGEAMTGGTSKIIKVVSQQDVDTAKQKIIDQNLQPGKDEVMKQSKADGYLPVTETFSAGAPVVTASPNVDAEATEVNVNVVVIYTVLGVSDEAIKQLVEDDIKLHIDITKQTILDNGLAKAVFQILDKRPNGDVKLSLQAEATAGVQQDTDSIKKTAAGKKKRETIELIKSRPGVMEVEVSYSPFWVQSTPKKTSKITVIFEQKDSNAERSN